MAAGKVPRDPFRPDMANLINLADFDDADLGDGGAFVSRLGADPIRDMPTSFQPGEPGWDGVPVPAIGPCLAEAMFRDFVAPDGATDRFWAERVDNVAMPVAVVAPDKDSTQPPATPETLLVSLVTYEPRFDIRREKGFVDVALDAGPYPDPFLRLGLVRYQKEALPGLECSSPVVRWTQVPPSRQIRVEWKERRAPKAAPLVDLSVSIYPAERRRVGGDGEAVPEPYIKSRFRVAIHLRQQTRAGRMEEIVAIGPDGTLLEFECQPYTLPAMTRTLCLSPLEAGKGEYLLVVDEVQAFESTVDRPAEPISGESKTPRDNPSVDSGPRFQFREVLDLPTRPVLPARRKAEPKAEPAIRRRRPTSPEAGEVAIPGNRPEGHGD